MAGDAHYNSVALLLHCDGSDGSTTFTDDGPGAHTVTANGNAQVDTAQLKFGAASALFDGSSDYLSLADHADWDFDTGDFTVELFARWADHSTVQTLVGNYLNSTTGWSFQRRSDTNTLRFGNGDTPLIDVSWTPSDSTWYHLAVCRSGTDIMMWADGVQVGSTATSSANISGSTNSLLIGALNAGGIIQGFNGHLDDIRITKGVARYTSGFTPPSVPFPGPDRVASSIDPGTTFGTPNAAYQQFGVATSLGPDTQFGTPQLLNVWLDADTLGQVTTFGTPIAGFDQTAAADPVGPVAQFGTPSVLQVCEASSIEPGTQIPMAFYAFNQALDASGFAPVRFGNAVALRFLPAVVNRICAAGSLAAAPRFGLPSASGAIACPASSLGPVATFGTPTATDTGRTLAATSLSPGTQIPTPAALLTQDASSLSPVANFGTPVALCTAHASSLQVTVRWGTPRATRANSYEVLSGIYLGGRFGQPTALARFNYPATSISPGVQFGTPVAAQRHRVTTIPPVTQFGEAAVRFLPVASSIAPGTAFGTPGVAT